MKGQASGTDIWVVRVSVELRGPTASVSSSTACTAALMLAWRLAPACWREALALANSVRISLPHGILDASRAPSRIPFAALATMRDGFDDATIESAACHRCLAELEGRPPSVAIEPRMSDAADKPAALTLPCRPRFVGDSRLAVEHTPESATGTRLPQPRSSGEGT